MTDPDKLAALRRRYADAKASEVHDPTFAKVAALLYTDPDRRKLPYAGVSTLLDAPVPARARRPGRSRRARRRAGRRADGPRRHQPRRRSLRPARGARRSSGSAPTNMCSASRRRPRLKVADIGDVPFRSRYSLTELPRGHRGASTPRIAAAGVRPLSVGGDHSITYPILRALAAREPAGRHGPHRRALRHRRRRSKAPNSIMAARSARPCSTACSIRSGRSRSASAARPSISGSSPRLRHDRDPCRGVRPHGPATPSSPERARWSATARPTSPSTSTASIPPSRPAPARRRSAA